MCVADSALIVGTAGDFAPPVDDQDVVAERFGFWWIWVVSTKAAERQQVVADGEKDLGSALLYNHHDPLAHTERIAVDVHTLATSAVPPVVRINVVRIRSVVVFPAPFGPSRPKMCPSGTAKVRPCRACTGAAPREWKVLRQILHPPCVDHGPFSVYQGGTQTASVQVGSP